MAGLFSFPRPTAHTRHLVLSWAAISMGCITKLASEGKRREKKDGKYETITA
jgi:hypothetical protein